MTTMADEASYFLRRAQEEAIRAIQATNEKVAAIHPDLSHRYSGVALASLRRGRTPAV